MSIEENNKNIAKLVGVSVEELKLKADKNKIENGMYDAMLEKGFEALTEEDRERIAKDLED